MKGFKSLVSKTHLIKSSSIVSLTSLFSMLYNNGHNEEVIIDYNNIDKVAVNLYNYSLFFYIIDFTQ